MQNLELNYEESSHAKPKTDKIKASLLFSFANAAKKKKMLKIHLKRKKMLN